MATPYNETIPWYQSRVIIGAVISSVLKIVALLGLTFDITEEEAQAAATVFALLGSLVGDYISAHARVTQKSAPPISLTNKSL